MDAAISLCTERNSWSVKTGVTSISTPKLSPDIAPFPNVWWFADSIIAQPFAPSGFTTRLTTLKPSNSSPSSSFHQNQQLLHLAYDFLDLGIASEQYMFA